ncbi:ABC transporter substrate-binding protein [Xylophilus sp.]|uniref:ABC transporter substrate-binding protein n=1 Tax=Xylophilus sp. TaxID=2653893 RepID=UPI0013B95351|nr:ABC transporter substrate-binding protein [Xylophilus sp.]KAF1049171.1 MAG: putative aliphatic sulfonates-binding protein [Xylophilus sp.]
MSEEGRRRTGGPLRHLLKWLAVPLAAALVLGACSKAPGEDAAAGAGAKDGRFVLRYEGSGSFVSLPELAADLGFFGRVKLEWRGDNFSGPSSIQNVVTGDTDFGGAFDGAIVKLIAAGAPIRSVVVSYGIDAQQEGGFYVLEGSSIRTARDLIGRKVAVNTLGAHSEFILREYLDRAGLTPEEARQVTLVVIPPVNGEQVLREGQVEVATLGGILRDKALERGGIRKLFSDHDLYGAFNAGSYVVRRELIRDRPEVVRDFVQGVARAVEWERDTPVEQVRERFADIIRRRGRNENTDLVRYWKTVGIHTRGGRIEAREIQVWIDWLVKAGELSPGQVAASDVFTNEFNLPDPN